MSFNFDDFIKILPHLYRHDPHTIPQSQTNFFGLTINLPILIFNEILKIEDTQKMEFLASEFNLDLSVRENVTSASKIEEYFDKATVDIFNQIYKRDFELYNYTQINAASF